MRYAYLPPLTIGADKAYDTRDFVDDCRSRKVTPHMAHHVKRRGGNAIDGRTHATVATTPAKRYTNALKNISAGARRQGRSIKSRLQTMSCHRVLQTRRESVLLLILSQ